MDTPDAIAHKQQLLRDAARDARGLKLRMHDSGSSFLEAVIARGDRRLGAVIEHAYRAGARFDSWEGRVGLELWRAAFAAHGVDESRYLGTLPVGARLPWDHVDVGLEDGFLAREYRKSLHSRLSPPCGKAKGMFVHHDNAQEADADQRRLVCYDCGIACDLSAMRAERIDFLREMRALEPRARTRLPLISNAERRKQQPETFRPVRPGNAPTRWRLSFAKTGPMALLGHLDLIRELPRVVRRAGVKTHYTAGYHPKPDMSFGPALSLGVASLDEYVDLKLIDAPEPAELCARLNQATAPGLWFTGAVELGPNDPGVNRILDGASYVVGLAEGALSPAELEAKIAEFLAKTEHRVRREIEGVGKMVDVRAFVRELRPGGADALSRAGIVGRALPLEVEVRFSQSGAVKVSEVVGAVVGDVPYIAVRTALTGGGKSALDLGAHRKVPVAEAPVVVPFEG